MSVYDRAASLALKQIAKYGRSVTFRQVTPGTFDPATYATTGNTTTDATVKAFFKDYKERQIDGEIIKRNDKQILIAASALSVTPQTNDTIVDGGVTYTIVNMETVKPGDVAVLYKMQGRK